MAFKYDTHFGIKARGEDGQEISIGLACVGFYKDLKSTALTYPVTFNTDAVTCPYCLEISPRFRSIRMG